MRTGEKRGEKDEIFEKKTGLLPIPLAEQTRKQPISFSYMHKLLYNIKGNKKPIWPVFNFRYFPLDEAEGLGVCNNAICFSFLVYMGKRLKIANL